MPEPRFSLEIDGAPLVGWTSVEIAQAVDACSSATFTAPFDPNDARQRDLFRPFSGREVVVKADGVALFRGVAMRHTPRGDASSTEVTVSCYSRAGVWEDCTAPADLRPLEFNGQTLDKIAKRLGAPFGLAPVFDSPPGAKFDKVKIEPDATILSFLADLAKQRDLVIGDNAAGDPVFRRTAESGAPVFTVNEGDVRPLVSVTSSTDGQALYSEVTGIAAAKHGRPGSSFTARPPFTVKGPRPLTITLQDTDPADVPAATRARIGRDIAAAATYQLEGIPTLLDASGVLFSPGTFVRLTYPRRMIYRSTLFLVRAVTLRIGPDAKTTDLEVTLPGVFSGTLPEVVPWEE